MAKQQKIIGIKTTTEMAQIASELVSEGINFVVTKISANQWEFDLSAE